MLEVVHEWHEFPRRKPKKNSGDMNKNGLRIGLPRPKDTHNLC